VLHGLAVRMDALDAQALGRAEVAQRDTARMFDQMMRVLQDNGAQAADDRRRFDDNQQARWSELHRDLKPLILDEVTALTRQMREEAARHKTSMNDTLEQLCLRADESERKATVNQKRFADTLHLLQIGRDVDERHATANASRSVAPELAGETTSQYADAAYLFEYDIPPMPLIDVDPSMIAQAQAPPLHTQSGGMQAAIATTAYPSSERLTAPVTSDGGRPPVGGQGPDR